MSRTGSAIVAGHICLDIIPQFDHHLAFDFRKQFQPGSLTKVGPAIFSTGGPVSNTGLVLHRLGIPTTLVAKTGKDLFGSAVRQIAAEFGTDLARGIAMDEQAATSYTVIVSPPDLDRLFLHCPGANDSFDSRDVPVDQVAKVDLFHFGYPPVMKRIYQNDGAELVKIFQAVKATGATTSLDLCMPDPADESGHTNWRAILQAVLPYVDIFLPSLDEILFMLNRDLFEQTFRGDALRKVILANPQLVSQLAYELIDMGAKVVMLKLGDCGAYLRTASREAMESLGRAAPADPGEWANREAWAPCFKVNLVGTTGSGDSTIAGFLSGLLRGMTLEQTLTSAVAVGACNVEAADALSGVPSWEAVQERIAGGWERRMPCDELPGWRWEATSQLWIGPEDRSTSSKLLHHVQPVARKTTERKPLFIINSVAPIRICDNGGWTDTWFAGHGKIFNIGVYPYAEVQLKVFPDGEQEERIIVNAENYGERYAVIPEKPWDKHPLLEASIAYMGVPQNLSFEVTIYSEAPSGASTGTSAAVTVALIGALDCLSPGRLTAHEVALAAQRVETEMLGGQCGIQDQLCSAYGGINYIEMMNYPYASVSQIQVPNATWWELERRLALIYLGKSHRSSDVHEMVIKGLENAGPDCKQLSDLRQTAPKARDALYAGDFAALGAAMTENTEAQARLHPALISAEARRVIEIAGEHGALGWKVNGAGGDGGSVTILCNDVSQIKRSMIREIEQENSLLKNIPIYLSRYGLRVWKQDCS
jgi:D-glycero-alpha-D-manno-heptose-7-phosphate kinase